MIYSLYISIKHNQYFAALIIQGLPVIEFMFDIYIYIDIDIDIVWW